MKCKESKPEHEYIKIKFEKVFIKDGVKRE